MWEQFFDDTHGRPYWHNNQTGETTWTEPVRPKPPPPPSDPPPSKRARQAVQWEEHHDTTYNRSYWYNPATGETVWERPPDAAPQPLPQQDWQGGQLATRPAPTPEQKFQSAPPPGTARTAGQVSQWEEGKGFGFITADSGERAYCHRTWVRSSPVVGSAGAALTVGERVTFILTPNDRNPGKWSAMDVTVGEICTVTSWERGFGFVQSRTGRRGYVHHSWVHGGGDLVVGEEVSARFEPNDRDPSKLSAKDVRRCGTHAVQQQPPLQQQQGAPLITGY
eukprot:TRINITY_DN70295_c0_g1_i1.p1 TRINITY_DN70295_c0_g1~~TRINITY_DN70295_c0_g1_i1.p1  ORF type:complete len:279 (+),score=54.27 TRINITY_DN70295_c0_g1_i1:135-971(+)